MCDMTYSYVRHESFICVSWLIYTLLKMIEACHTHEWVMAHTWMSQVTHMNESSHTREWVMSHTCMHLVCICWYLWLIRMCNVTHSYDSFVESCHTYKWVMSHTWMSHITHMNESCHTYEWVQSHIWMSHATNMKTTQQQALSSDANISQSGDVYFLKRTGESIKL